MEAFLASTLLVALAELGDKSQLFCALLAARYRRPGLILGAAALGAFVAHLLAAALGVLLGHLLQGSLVQWVMAAGFLGMAVWMLLPPGQGAALPAIGTRSLFVGTAAATLVMEIGDKTQLATVVLAARYDSILTVTAGATLGLVLALVPAVLVGRHAWRLLAAPAVRYAAAALFTGIAAFTLLGR